MNDQWQDNLRNRMEHHEEPAPDGLWESIEQLVPAGNKQRLWSQNIIPLVAAAAAIALLFIVLYNTNNEEKVEYTQQTITEEVQPRERIKEAPKNEPQVLIASRQSSNNSDYVVVSDNIEDNISTYETISETISKKNTLLEIETTKDFTIKPSIVNNSNDQLFASSSIAQRQESSKWQTKVSMSNMPSGSAQTYTGYGTFALQETVEEQYDFLSKYTRQEVYTNVEHDQPITFGLTLRYNLSQKWDITSGLTYSMLKSQLRSGGDNYHYDDRQTLHYIGVPLNIAYNFWQSNNLSSYISAGTHVQKNIAGTLSSNYYIDEQLELNTKEKVLSNKLQWSVNSAIGIEYRVSDFIGIYAEPGIDYYFKNSSELETIYKERPFSFNLRLGVRLNINQ